MAYRDEMADSSRDGSGQKTKAEVGFEVPMSPASLADEAWYDDAMGKPTVGTASDHADATGDIHRRRVKTYKGPNTP